MNTKEILRNFTYVFFSQAISLLISIIISFVLPKLLNLEGYGYWQYFLLLTSYVGFFHLGLIDGIYLRYSGKIFSVANKQLLKSQFKLLFFLQVFIVFLVVIYALTWSIDLNKKYVIIAVAFFLLLANLSSFFGIIFQSFNKLKIYSIATVLDKFIFIFSLIFLILFNTENFKYYIIFYILSRILGLVYSVFYGKAIFFAKAISIKEAFVEFKKNISVGILVTLSNIFGILILGFGRFIIEKNWGINNFGKISLSIAMTSFFLLFISQTSIILFPVLLNIEKEMQKYLYTISGKLLNFVLNGIFLFFPLVNIIVALWLPSYLESIHYFIILFPLCLFEGKMQILLSTYIKILRKEKLMLFFNAISLICAVLLALIGLLMQSIEFIVYSMTITIVFRSIIIELYLSKIYNINISKHLMFNILLSIIFCMVNLNFAPMSGFIIYLLVYSFYLLIQKNDVKEVYAFTKKLKMI